VIDGAGSAYIQLRAALSGIGLGDVESAPDVQ